MLLILSIIILLILTVTGIVIVINDDNYDIRAFVLIFSLFTSIVTILLLVQIPKPTAIDVYKGKTTLEVTYRDGVAVDSIVVFKK